MLFNQTFTTLAELMLGRRKDDAVTTVPLTPAQKAAKQKRREANRRAKSQRRINRQGC